MGSEEIKILGDDELLKIQEERDIEHQRKALSLSAFPMLTQKSKFGLVYPKCVENIFTILTYHPDFSEFLDGMPQADASVMYPPIS